MDRRLRDRSSVRFGFTLIELLVVIAIIAILIGLLLPAVQKVREAANRARCQNNLKQIALAMQTFHDANAAYPTYQGISKANGTNTQMSGNTKAVYGSWIVHILPYLEQGGMYDQISGDVQQYSNTGLTVTAPGGPLITPAVPGVAALLDTAGLTFRPAIPATYNNYVGSLQYVATTNSNGFTVYTQQYVPARTPDVGSNIAAGYYRLLPNGTWQGPISPPVITPAIPGIPAVYGPPGAPINGYINIYNLDTRKTIIKSLLCPSDPSPGSDPAAGQGIVYANTTGPWAATNYLANWNAITQGVTSAGFMSPAQRTNSVTDGLSNTVLLSEAYEWCDGRGRTAYVAWHNNNYGGSGSNGNYGGVHNFGLTYGLNNVQLSVAGGAPQTVNAANGLPSPGGNPEVTFMFQVQPLAKAANACPAGADCCNTLTVQSGHSVLHVAMGDGSVRNLSAGMASDNWRRMLLPRDGEPVSFE